MTASSSRPATKRDQPPSAIDENHLGRMTLGDRQLEREVLEIFVRQSALMFERIDSAEPAVAAASAHTLLGSARGIGAWRVARAAELLERAAGRPESEAAIPRAIAELKAACLEASAAIAVRLNGVLAHHPHDR